MLFVLDDYDEKGIITPQLWFDVSVARGKLDELKGVERFVMTFGYMKGLIEEVKSLRFREVGWYPNLGIFELEGEDVGFVVSPIGAPAITTILEELVCLGGKYFILTGGVGVLFEEIGRGEVIIVDGAIRDEGTSYHYFPPEKDVRPSRRLVEALEGACERMGVEFHRGKVWTTDAPYRETPSRIRTFRDMGAICVDMEAAACFAVAEYRDVELAAIFYGGDYVSERGWDSRKKGVTESREHERRLFRIICEVLKGVG